MRAGCNGMADKKRRRDGEEDEFEHGWAAKPRYLGDDQLRAAGFKIHGRVRVKGRLRTTWERDGKVYEEAEALRLASEVEE